MDKRFFRKLWLKALRSGEYRQGRRKLCEVDKNGVECLCCLGVACKVYIKYINPEFEKHCTRQDGESYIRFDGKHLYAPQVVVDALGLNGSAGDCMSNGVSTRESLASMNDDGKTFQEIADFIEANPKLVYKQRKSKKSA